MGGRGASRDHGGVRGDGRLALLDAEGKEIHEVTASSGLADTDDAFDRILDEPAERQVNFAA